MKTRSIAILVAMILILTIFIVPRFAFASTAVLLVQPVNQTISGTYEFIAKVLSTTAPVVTFTIDGTAYSTVIEKAGTIDTYYAVLYFTTGNLHNGVYSWYATVTFIGSSSVTKSSSASFTVDNYIKMSADNPVQLSTVHGIQVFAVSTQPTSDETVNSVTMVLLGTSYTMTESSTNYWTQTIDTLSLPNGQNSVYYSASGSSGVTGSLSVSFTVSNPIYNNYHISYLEGTTYYNTTQPAVGTVTSLVDEGYYSMSSAMLELQPTSKVTKIIINPPSTVGGVYFMFAPFTASTYYNYSSSRTYNWSTGWSYYLYDNSNGIVVTTSNSFNIPIWNASTISNTILYSGANLLPEITSNWTIGVNAKAFSTNSIFVGTSTFNFYATPDGTNAFYPSVNISTTAGNYYNLVSTASIPLYTWFSMAFSVQPQSNNLTKDTIWVDGQSVPYSVTQTITTGQTLDGMANTLTISKVDFFDFWSIKAYITSTTTIQDMMQPENGQPMFAVNPPFYVVSQNYYQLTIANGSQPWSAFFILSLEQFNGLTQSLVSYSFNSAFGEQNTYSFITNVTYTPYFSITHYSVSPLSSVFSIPLGSLLTITVYNEWNQSVGALINQQVTQQSEQFSVYLALSTLTFQFENTTEQFVLLTANGITQEFYASAFVGLGYTYAWNSTIFANGNNELYQGTVTVTQTTQVLYIYANPPPASLTVSVFAYSGSQYGTITSGGNPRVNLYINGAKFQVGETYYSSIDAVLNITITDVSGQTLYTTNYTLLSSSNSLVVNITTPSFILQFQNAEQAPSGSVLATEIINISTPVSSPKYYYNTSTAIGQIQTMYLKEGTYHVYIHDNATFSQNITLNKSESWVIFGQKLVTLQVFLNDTRQILNNSAKLIVIPVRQISQLSSGTSYSFQYEIKFPDGLSLTSLQLHYIVQNSTFSIYLASDGLKASASLASNQTLIFANFTSGSTGAYNFVFLGYLIVSGQSYGVEYDNSFTINSITFYINVFAYNSSGIGLLNDAGLGGVHLYVDNILQPLGQQLVGFVGSNTIVITDSINQTLYSSTVTLTQTTNEITVYITKPSWSLGLQNAEQAPVGSALATETIWVNTSTLSGKFLEGISQTLSLYLLQGTYNITVKDNFTGKIEINLTSDQFFVFFGQKFLTYSQFQQTIGQLINESAKLVVVPIRVSPSFLPSTNASFSFTVSFGNGTLLTPAEIHSFALNGSFDIYPYNSSAIIPVSLSVVGTTIFANFTTGSVNTYNYILEGYLQINGQFWGAKYSNTFLVETISNTSFGLSITIAGASTIEVNTNNTYIIHLSYMTGLPLSKSNTASVFLNMTAELYKDGLFYKLIPLLINSEGYIVAIVNVSHNGTYVLTISVKATSIAGNKNASASNYLQINVVPYNPTGQNSWGQLVNFLSLNADIIGIGTALVAVSYYIYRRLRRKPIAKKQAVADSETIIISNIIRRALEVDDWNDLTPTDRIVLSRLDAKTLHKIIFNLTGENRKTVSAMMEQIQQKNSKWERAMNETKKTYRKLRSEI